MTEAAIISGSLVDVRNVGTHKSIKLTIHIPEEHATRVVAAFGWPTGVNPVSVAIARLNTEPQRAVPPAPAVASPRPVVTVSPAGAEASGSIERRKFAGLPYAQQAALRCNDPIYRAFLREVCAKADARDTVNAAVAVRDLCEVESRSDIRAGTDAETKWLELEQWFDTWKMRDRVTA